MAEAMKAKLLLLAVLLLAPRIALHAGSLDIVKDGRVINLVHPEPGHAYTSRNGALKLRDARRRPYLEPADRGL